MTTSQYATLSLACITLSMGLSLKADSITVTNKKSDPYWVAVFYTYTKDGKKILVPNQDDEWPNIDSRDSKITSNKTITIERPSLRFRDNSGKVKLWYDRDLIALNSHGYTEYVKQKKSLKNNKAGEIKLPTPTAKGGGTFGNDYGYWLNVGSTKGVNAVDITDNFGLIKVG